MGKRIEAMKASVQSVVAEANLQTMKVKASPIFVGAMIAMSSFPVAMAADPKGLLKTIIEILGGLIVALAVIMVVMGLVKWATAHSDGDGPAEKKAIGMLAAAVMLVSLSIILINKADELASYIS